MGHNVTPSAEPPATSRRPTLAYGAGRPSWHRRRWVRVSTVATVLAGVALSLYPLARPFILQAELLLEQRRVTFGSHPVGTIVYSEDPARVRAMRLFDSNFVSYGTSAKFPTEADVPAGWPRGWKMLGDRGLPT